MAQIAQQEYTNTSRNYEVGNNCNYYTGHVRFTTSGCPSGWGRSDWCADFVHYIWKMAGGVGYLNEIDGWAQSFKDYAIRHGTWHAAGSGYRPMPGDAVVYKDLGGVPGKADHVGLVYSYNGTLTTIEGNWGDRISRRTNPSNIQGYASPVVADRGGRSGVRVDIHGDGAGDAVLFATLANGNAETRIYSTKGVRTPLTETFAIRPATTKVTATDWDGDGDDDIILASTTPAGNVELRRVITDPSKPTWTVPGYPQLITATNMPATDFQVAGGDVNGDGFGDVVVFALMSDGLAEARVYSTRGVTAPLRGTFTIRPSTTRLTMSDWDGDRDDDIIFATTTAAGNVELRWLISDKTKPEWVVPGYPQLITGTNMPATDFQVAGGDVNGDRVGDIAVFALMSNGLAQARVYSRRGVVRPLDGTFAIRPATARISLFDWDGDRDDDLMFATTSSAGNIEIRRIITDASRPGWVVPGYPQLITETNLPATNFQMAR